VWYGFSFLIPPGFPVVDNRLVIAQWKQSGVPGSPLIAQRFRNGRHELTVRPPGARESEWARYPLPNIDFGRWNDMIYHVRFSSGSDGRVEVWMNGSAVVSHRGPTSVDGGKNYFYNKIGLYRDRWPKPMTIFFDDYTLADSFEAVDCAGADRTP